MGLGSSRMGAAPPHRAGPLPRRRRCTIKRTISPLLICGGSSSSNSGEMGDYPAESLVNSAELGHQEKLKFIRIGSDLCGADRTDVKTENGIASGRCLAADENIAPELRPSNVGYVYKDKCLSDDGELVPCQFVASYRRNDASSTSCVDHPSPNCVSAAEKVMLDAVNGIDSTLNEDSFRVVESLSNSSSLRSNGLGESLLDEVSAENDVSEAIDSDSSIEFNHPSALGFLVSEREENRQNGSLVHGDVMGISPNFLSSNSVEISIHESRRNSRRLFWDAFSRRSSRTDDSRSFVYPSDEADHLRSSDGWFLDFSGDFSGDEFRGDNRTRGSRTQETNEQRWNSRSEIWERLRGGLEFTDLRTAVCPRRIHADGSCSCQSGLPAEESGARAGISRIVLLAQALFEVLDQIHRQPMSLSLSMVSLSAPESVVDSFPVKIRKKEERLDCGDDISHCYICLAEYEEGDKIRVLPCCHEYHMSCVDKWLKEIHGVCPLCRGDVREGSTESSVLNRELHSH